MRTSITCQGLSEQQREAAEEAIGRCVHCGFCNASCPTFRLLGDELDGPRGRIYQIKSVLEGAPVTATFKQHLERCLTCRNCETSCPSGVNYSSLLGVGRSLIAQHIDNKVLHCSIKQRALRYVLLHLVAFPERLRWVLAPAQCLRKVLPKRLGRHIPRKDARTHFPVVLHRREVVLPGGCVQSVTKTNTNASCRRILARFGVAVHETDNRCCGALAHHLGDEKKTLEQVRANISVWVRALDEGAEAVIMTASACGLMVKEYPQLFARGSAEWQRAKRVAESTRDLSEWLSAEEVSRHLNPAARSLAVAFHPPCTLQHGQNLRGNVERVLVAAACQLLPFADTDQCCGSAGSYSLFQPQLAKKFIREKVRNLQAVKPDVIATANIGCQLYIEQNSPLSVKHWIEILDERMR